MTEGEARGVSFYWQNMGKTDRDKRSDGRTFLRSDGILGCDECCFGDRCDDPSHVSRERCRYCLGTGSVPGIPVGSDAPETETEAERFGKKSHHE